MGNSDSNLTDVKKTISTNPVVVYSKTTCPYCVKAKNLLDNQKINYVAYELNKIASGDEVGKALRGYTGLSFVPQIFICGKLIGGFGELSHAHENGVLQKLVQECSRHDGASKTRQ